MPKSKCSLCGELHISRACGVGVFKPAESPPEVPGARFQRRVEQAGPLDVTVLASSAPEPSVWDERTTCPRCDGRGTVVVSEPQDGGQDEKILTVARSRHASGHAVAGNILGGLIRMVDDLTVERDDAIASDLASDAQFAKLIAERDELREALKESEARVFHPATQSINRIAEGLENVDGVIRSVQSRTIEELRAQLETVRTQANDMVRLFDEVESERDELRSKMDCCQDLVCATPPGCARHWEERNRELVAELGELRAKLAEQEEWYQKAVCERENRTAIAEAKLAEAEATQARTHACNEALLDQTMDQRERIDELLKSVEAAEARVRTLTDALFAATGGHVDLDKLEGR